ncbi:MAG: endonuclease III [Bacteroidales bacterium]|nr:endonuclease III [Bacteroidales bacterium]
MRRPQKHIDNIVSVFQQTIPKAESELKFNNNFELLVAVMLSAQCTDKRVNMVTPALFKAYPDAESMAKATDKEILEYISSISYPNSKASHLAEMARKLTNDFKGIVPDNMDDLQSLPGVGRKTANVIMAVAFNAAAMPVDTHVYRVARRLGLSKDSHTPVETEAQLSALFPSELLSTAHHWLLLHGRYTCTARNPKCSECSLLSYCQGIN